MPKLSPSVLFALWSLPLLGGCPEEPPIVDDTVETDTDPMPSSKLVDVEVWLDGSPVQGALVAQGGRSLRWLTDAQGRTVADVDFTRPGEVALLASHPEARTWFAELDPTDDAVRIELVRFDPSDNEDYVFLEAGVPGEQVSASVCSHCHVTLDEDWYASPHRSATSNPVLQDLYAGTAASLTTSAACTAAGGQWWSGILPGDGGAAMRCYLGEGTLPTLNTGCGTTSACDDVATAFGACADCHAPAIDGVLGGRDLLEATGRSYDYGIHCDFCHKVESVDLTAPAGVGGRLRVVRPSEESPTAVADWQPLTFGPYDDVGNPVMGAVPRDHYTKATFCAGCHELDQAVLVPGATIDSARWPAGTLPIHSTYTEWQEWSLSELTSCRGCHMPGDLGVGNASDLGNVWGEAGVDDGIVFGWTRPPGSVRQHSWIGPRTPASGLLQTAAILTLTKQVDTGELTVTATVANTGAGHAIPTGEPLRSLVLLVDAQCTGQPLVAVGGDAVPDFGGYLDRQTAADDWSIWPGAAVGDVVRVISLTGTPVDYTGPGPFGDGTFSAAQKGMAEERVVGQATVVAVAGEVVTFDTSLPTGDVAYRTAGGALPANGDPVTARAGSPGFAFARVLVGDDGRRMVPHFAAVDVASDNRLPADESWTSTHRFTATCADPDVTAVLVHRAYPLALAAERGWALTESVVATATQ